MNETATKSFRRQAAIQLRIKNPNFWNRKFSTIDVSHYLRYLGQDDILRNPAMRYLLEPFANISKSIDVSDHYMNEKEYRNLCDFEYLGVRGPLSAKVLNNRGIDCDIVGDTALVLEPKKYHPEESKKAIVTLRDGGEKWNSTESYRTSVIEFCKQHEDEYTFIFLPHTPSDIPLHINMAKEINNSRFVDFCSYMDIEGAINITSKADFVIGEKLHANVLSASTFTPFISLEYQLKNKDFAKSINMEDFNKRIGNVTTEWLNNRFDRILHSTKYQNKIENEVSDIRSKLRSYRSEILNTLASSRES